MPLTRAVPQCGQRWKERSALLILIFPEKHPDSVWPIECTTRNVSAQASDLLTSFLWRQAGYFAAAVLTGAIFWAINQPLPSFATVMVYALCMGNLVVYPMEAVRCRFSASPPARKWLICIVALLVLAPLIYVTASAVVILIAPPSSQSLSHLIRNYWKFPMLVFVVYAVMALLYTETKERLERRNLELQKSVELGAARLERQKQELQRARDIQEALLPREIFQLPRFEVAAVWQPARAVGGDYFDVLPLDQNRLAICIGDVVGKGLSAALLMANLQAAVRAFARESDNPAWVCSRVNRGVGESVADGKYVTFFYGILNSNSRTLHYCNAGHLCPILVSSGSTHRISEGDAVLGIFPDWTYRAATVELSRGDRLLLFTDGITDPKAGS